MFDIGPRLFALPPGCDFPQTLVLGLRKRLAGHPPEAMARVTVYVNTARMRRRIRDIFTAGGAGFLPKLHLITEIDQSPFVDVQAPISALRRRLELANLVSALISAQPELAPAAAAFDLAGSLERLMDEMQSEGVLPQTIHDLDVSTHSKHWERAQAFLNIIIPLFADAAGPEARTRMAALQLAQQWQTAPPQDPIIVAGSTGSRGTTALFMQAVLQLPQGAIVLPGFDFDMPHGVWGQMDDALTAEDHPQFRFRRLMDMLNLSRNDVQLWSDTPAPQPNRNRLISLSMRPAPVTDQWLSEGPALPDLLESTENISLIEAMTPRSEAMAIALVLRRAANDGIRAALISPDRNLTRRVTAALDHWSIIPDDSAGKPLAHSAPGRFLRHIAALFTDRVTSDGLLTLLKHPLTHSGAGTPEFGRGEHLKLTRDLELRLRKYGPMFPTHSDVMTWAQTQKTAGAAPWAAGLLPIFTALQNDAPMPLAAHVQRHLNLAETVACGHAQGSGALWLKEAGMAAFALMSELAREAPFGGTITAVEYRSLFDSLIHQGEVREAVKSHPNIMIWGTIEARVQGAELVILGGLNDSVWPQMPEPDPWLNRKMRKDSGLLLPERQIGLSAHDYQQAMGAPQVVITRAKRNAESETVPSRWLNRLVNLMDGLPSRNGPAGLAEMRARGDVWLGLAEAMDQPDAAMLLDPRLQPALRPAPQPPVSARPPELPLTAIETLIRDPYEIYARYILRLRPLDPLRAAPDARDRGIVVHAILEAFVKQRPPNETRIEARNRLMEIAREELLRETPFPATRAIWLAKLNRAADHFLTQDAKHAGTPLAVESKGRQALEGLNFALFGTPDRIDRLPNGQLHLIDYKTGKPPSIKEQSHFAKQLLLAAAMAERGGFADLGPNQVEMITYIGLGADEKTVTTKITPEILDAEWGKLLTLMSRYLQRSAGYTARRALFETRFDRNYDHLSRFGEWQMTDRAARPQLVGDKEKS